MDNVRKTALLDTGNEQYLFVTALNSDALNVFRISEDGTLEFLETQTHHAPSNIYLDGAIDVTVTEIDGSYFVAVTGFSIGSIQIFEFDLQLQALTPIDYVLHDGTSFLGNVTNISSMVVGGTNYIFTGGINMLWGISIFDLTADGMINTNVTNIEDTEQEALSLNSFSNLKITSINDTPYLFTASEIDDGVSVFQIENSGNLTHIQTVFDSENPSFSLENPAIAIFSSPATSYLYTGSYLSNGDDTGISRFSIADDGNLTYINNTTNGGNGKFIEDVFKFQMTSTTFNNKPYLLVPYKDGDGENHLNIFSINPTNGSLSPFASYPISTTVHDIQTLEKDNQLFIYLTHNSSLEVLVLD